MRFMTPEEVEKTQEDTRNGVYGLRTHEVWWRDHEDELKEHGYVLRPRFRRDWVPKWLGNDLKPFYCEDVHWTIATKVIDATRTSDGMTVILKKLRRDRRNRCVPILGDFALESDRGVHIMVLPLLRPFDDPLFELVSEVMDFVEQTLEGLTFIHEHGIAHRDLSNLNVMLDGTTMYPQGFHPTEIVSEPSARRLARRLRRADVASIKYYFIDFELSTHFEDPYGPRLVTGAMAQDHDVPD